MPGDTYNASNIYLGLVLGATYALVVECITSWMLCPSGTRSSVARCCWS